MGDVNEREVPANLGGPGERGKLPCQSCFLAQGGDIAKRDTRVAQTQLVGDQMYQAGPY